VQQTIEEENLLENVRNMGSEFEQALISQFGKHPAVGDIRGRGLFWGLELVADRASKEPFDPALRIDQAIKHQAMEHGLMCFPGSGTIDGTRGNHIMLAPPYIIQPHQIQEIVARLAQALDAALEDRGVPT
ncbi:MAG: aminotransferase class III-fold pyridoxal phosphate-dependent enzyme, partial [Proteobacteria bacterium]|nr:aminotransferase class III-fold pyridoxal phosphate-dependent enzyme [Pseudomonadota bacterium]